MYFYHKIMIIKQFFFVLKNTSYTWKRINEQCISEALLFSRQRDDKYPMWHPVTRHPNKRITFQFVLWKHKKISSLSPQKACSDFIFQPQVNPNLYTQKLMNSAVLPDDWSLGRRLRWVIQINNTQKWMSVRLLVFKKLQDWLTWKLVHTFIAKWRRILASFLRFKHLHGIVWKE